MGKAARSLSGRCRAAGAFCVWGRLSGRGALLEIIDEKTHLFLNAAGRKGVLLFCAPHHAPVLNNWLYPEEEPQTVTFPQEKDEMLPEDMLTEGETGTQTESETEMAEQVTTQIAAEETPASEVETAESASTEDPQKAYLTEYQAMYDSLHQVYQEASTSIVTVTAVKSDVAWFNNTYQSEGNIAGVIIANNNRELLILTRKSPLDKAQSMSSKKRLFVL